MLKGEFCCSCLHASPAAPVNQATHFYREGQYTSCSDCWKDFTTSIAAKMCNDEAEALVSQSGIISAELARVLLFIFEFHRRSAHTVCFALRAAKSCAEK